MKIKVEKMIGIISEITVYIDDDTMSASDVVCVVSHLARYGTLTAMCSYYPFTNIRLSVKDDDIEEMLDDIRNDGFDVDVVKA